MPPIALTIAGSDPSGGAGIQADLKTFHQFGVYGEAVIALLTVQNTVRVSRVVVMPPALVLAQLAAVLEDIPPGAAKTGALGSTEMVQAVARAAADFKFPLVVDPVMVTKHGVSLLPDTAVAAVRELLLPRAFLITPNVPEAEALTGMEIHSLEDMRLAACRLRDMGARWEKLHAKGARVQRLLWASTGTKNKHYSDVLYVEELIAADTVNTLPPSTMDAFRDHGRVRASLEENIDQARQMLATLGQSGISIASVTAKLVDRVRREEASSWSRAM